MAKVPRSLLALPAAGLGYLAGQVWHAGHRKDLPSHTNQEVSGTFGNPGDQKLRLVVVGDSSITCPGVEVLDDCFIRRIAIHLSDRYFVVLTSLAVGGSRASDVLEDQLREAVALEPDLAICSVGANDAIRATPVGRFESQVFEVVAALHEASRAVVVMGVGDLGTIPRLPPTLRPFVTYRTRRFDDAITRVADQFERVARTDNWGRMSAAFASGDPEMFAADRFHASGLGHAVFAEEALPAVEEILPYASGERR